MKNSKYFLAFVVFFMVSIFLNQKENMNTSSLKLNINLKSTLNGVQCDCNQENFSSNFGMTELDILTRTKDCRVYFKDHMSTFAFDPPTLMETAFPLAFASTVHKQIGIWELFLAMYFRPTDAHCVHVDPKASPEIIAAVKSIVGCYKKEFPQATIFVSDKSIPVFWAAGGSILEADMICYRQLLVSSHPFKMVANIAGTELPLVSHQKFRETLQRHNRNVIYIGKNNHQYRQQTLFEEIRNGSRPIDIEMRMVQSGRRTPPCDIYIYKGYKNGAFTRAFLKFVTQNSFSIDLYNWLSDTESPEEHFLNTMASLHIEEIKQTWDKSKATWKVVQRYDKGLLKQTDNWNNATVGTDVKCYKEYSYDGNSCNETTNKCPSEEKSGDVISMKSINGLWSNNICYRSSFWDDDQCKGENIRHICNFSLEDLRTKDYRSCLIGNKFNLNITFGAQAILCQVKELIKLTREHQTGLEQTGV